MYKILRSTFLLFLFFIYTGCSQKNFIRPSSDVLILGKTTYSQLVKNMGVPSELKESLHNGKNVKEISYVYSSSEEEALEQDILPSRTTSYYFNNDVLIGEYFNSSFKSDNSNYNDTMIDSIIKGQTTREKVLQLLGRPSILAIYPMIKESDSEVIGYQYRAMMKGSHLGSTLAANFKIGGLAGMLIESADDKGIGTIFYKSLIITINDKGIVSNIQSDSTTERF